MIFPTKTATCGGRNSSFSAPAGRGSCRKNHFLREKVRYIVGTKPDESTCQLSPTEGRSYATRGVSPGKLREQELISGGLVSAARRARLAGAPGGRWVGWVGRSFSRSVGRPVHCPGSARPTVPAHGDRCPVGPTNGTMARPAGDNGAAVARPEFVPISGTGKWAKNILFIHLLQTNPHVKF